MKMLDDLTRQLILSDSLEGPDPYDVWTTRAGEAVKRLYHGAPVIGFLPSAALILIDRYVNNAARIGYPRREYASVRAMAAQAAVILYESTGERIFRDAARRHLLWLNDHTARTQTGAAWGHGFPWVVSADLTYPADAPLATSTPYALEAAILYTEVTGETEFLDLIGNVLDFYDNDLVAMIDTDEELALSYSDRRDRVVTNAVSYVMAGYAAALRYVHQSRAAWYRRKIQRLNTFICKVQRPDGAWFYSPCGDSFIDCFHSCFVIKNLIKTALHTHEELPPAVKKGYAYLRSAFYDERSGLMRRFSVAPRPWVARYDLYDNAETIIAASLIGDKAFAERLFTQTAATFRRGNTIYSEIDVFGIPHNPGMLRWAVMPFVLSHLLVHSSRGVDLYLREPAFACGTAIPVSR